MARTIGKLTVLQVSRATEPGLYGDGAGLFLKVKERGSKSWVLRYKKNGRSHALGLGPLHIISLAEARVRAAEARRQILDGGNPVVDRKAAKVKAEVEAADALAKARTFDDVALEYIDAHKAGWKNAKHADQWRATLATYATPVFGHLPVAAVDTALVLAALKPIWSTKAETAARVRGRIEAVLDFAKVLHYRTGENPARWKGNLEHALPKRADVAPVEHHAALPYTEVAEFMAELRERDGIAARALEFTVLTATRTSETLNATWDEIDLENRIWTIPPERMKSKKEHRVPLCGPAVAILRDIPRVGEFVFPGLHRGKALSNMALLTVLRRMGRGHLTTHGMRSTFRDWGSDVASFPNELLEMALAHRVPDATERAYRRSDMFVKRVLLMQAWAGYCEGESAEPENCQPEP
jgi:integrase